MKTPKFCIITPTAYLEQYASQSEMHLVLAHLVDTNEEYANFYANRIEFKIMDCSAYELKIPYAPDKLIALGQKCKANVLVLPDYPFAPAQKTIDAAIKYIPLFKEAGFRTFFVPQSKEGDLEDWVRAYSWAVENSDIDIVGMSILGIPNALPHVPKSYARVVMAQLLIDRGIFDFKKYHHWLGLQNTSLEIPPLLKMGVIDSLDSSQPVQAALCGTRFEISNDSWITSKSHFTEVDFNCKMTHVKQVLENIQYNIDEVKKIFETTQPSSEFEFLNSKLSVVL